MNAIRILAAAAIVITTQAYAAPTTIVPGTLTATPSGKADGREIYFKLPLNGDTSKCIVTVTYGEKPAPGNVYPFNDGDTHINGSKSLDRVRTYTNDGTYTFTAKAKSGCTGEAKVTFTIGNGARSGVNPALIVTPAVAISAQPGLTVTPAKMTGIDVSATKLMVGDSLTVKLNGVGMPTDPACGSRIEIAQVGKAKEWNGYPGVKQTMENFTKWPKTQTFLFKQAGQYIVQLGVYSGAPAHCGYKGPGSVPGDLTKIEVTEIPVAK